MKKTLISCAVLLSSLVSAVEVNHAFTSTTGTNFNKELQNYLLGVGYKAGDKFSLTLTINKYTVSERAPLFTLMQGYYVITQQMSYFGLSTSTDSLTNANVGSISYNGTTNVHTYTNEDGKKLCLWTQNKDATASATSSMTRGVSNQMTLTVFDNGNTTGVKLSYDNAGGHTDEWILTGVDFDATKFSVYKEDATISNASITLTQDTPEPATATLSLLALMGLAARRRRKLA